MLKLQIVRKATYEVKLFPRPLESNEELEKRVMRMFRAHKNGGPDEEWIGLWDDMLFSNPVEDNMSSVKVIGKE